MKNAITVNENGKNIITPKDGYVLTTYQEGDDRIMNISKVIINETLPEPKNIYAMKISKYESINKELNK